MAEGQGPGLPGPPVPFGQGTEHGKRLQGRTALGQVGGEPGIATEIGEPQLEGGGLQGPDAVPTDETALVEGPAGRGLTTGNRNVRSWDLLHSKIERVQEATAAGKIRT